MPRPLYDARLRDLGARYRVKVTCTGCSHTMRLVADYLRKQDIQDYEPILALKRRLRCTRCHSQGHVHISVEWKE